MPVFERCCEGQRAACVGFSAPSAGGRCIFIIFILSSGPRSVRSLPSLHSYLSSFMLSIKKERNYTEYLKIN